MGLFAKDAKGDRTIKNVLAKSILFGEATEIEALGLADPPPELVREPFGNKELRASVKAMTSA